MGDQRTSARVQPAAWRRSGRSAGTLLRRKLARAECLDQLLLAFRDIADLDDIHQAAERLASVQAWIREETELAAADPIFAEPLAV
jgi:hypothetical protein